jgi:hypothetical protein
MFKETKEKIRAEIEAKTASSPLYILTLKFFDSLSEEESFQFLLRSGIIDKEGALIPLEKWKEKNNG